MRSVGDGRIPEEVCGVTTVVDVDVGDSPDTNAEDSTGVGKRVLAYPK
jgi:hypothetical protein